MKKCTLSFFYLLILITASSLSAMKLTQEIIRSSASNTQSPGKECPPEYRRHYDQLTDIMNNHYRSLTTLKTKEVEIRTCLICMEDFVSKQNKVLFQNFTKDLDSITINPIEHLPCKELTAHESRIFSLLSQHFISITNIGEFTIPNIHNPKAEQDAIDLKEWCSQLQQLLSSLQTQNQLETENFRTQKEGCLDIAKKIKTVLPSVERKKSIENIIGQIGSIQPLGISQQYIEKCIDSINTILKDSFTPDSLLINDNSIIVRSAWEMNNPTLPEKPTIDDILNYILRQTRWNDFEWTDSFKIYLLQQIYWNCHQHQQRITAKQIANALRNIGGHRDRNLKPIILENKEVQRSSNRFWINPTYVTEEVVQGNHLYYNATLPFVMHNKNQKPIVHFYEEETNQQKLEQLIAHQSLEHQAFKEILEKLLPRQSIVNEPSTPTIVDYLSDYLKHKHIISALTDNVILLLAYTNKIIHHPNHEKKKHFQNTYEDWDWRDTQTISGFDRIISKKEPHNRAISSQNSRNNMKEVIRRNTKQTKDGVDTFLSDEEIEKILETHLAILYKTNDEEYSGLDNRIASHQKEAERLLNLMKSHTKTDINNTDNYDSLCLAIAHYMLDKNITTREKNIVKTLITTHIGSEIIEASIKNITSNTEMHNAEFKNERFSRGIDINEKNIVFARFINPDNENGIISVKKRSFQPLIDALQTLIKPCTNAEIIAQARQTLKKFKKHQQKSKTLSKYSDEPSLFKKHRTEISTSIKNLTKIDITDLDTNLKQEKLDLEQQLEELDKVFTNKIPTLKKNIKITLAPKKDIQIPAPKKTIHGLACSIVSANNAESLLDTICTEIQQKTKKHPLHEHAVSKSFALFIQDKLDHHRIDQDTLWLALKNKEILSDNHITVIKNILKTPSNENHELLDAEFCAAVEVSKQPPLNEACEKIKEKINQQKNDTEIAVQDVATFIQNILEDPSILENDLWDQLIQEQIVDKRRVKVLKKKIQSNREQWEEEKKALVAIVDAEDKKSIKKSPKIKTLTTQNASVIKSVVQAIAQSDLNRLDISVTKNPDGSFKTITVEDTNPTESSSTNIGAPELIALQLVKDKIKKLKEKKQDIVCQELADAIKNILEGQTEQKRQEIKDCLWRHLEELTNQQIVDLKNLMADQEKDHEDPGKNNSTEDISETVEDNNPNQARAGQENTDHSNIYSSENAHKETGDITEETYGADAAADDTDSEKTDYIDEKTDDTNSKETENARSQKTTRINTQISIATKNKGILATIFTYFQHQKLIADAQTDIANKSVKEQEVQDKIDEYNNKSFFAAFQTSLLWFISLFKFW